MAENFLYQVAKADAELFHSNMLAFLLKKYPQHAGRLFGMTDLEPVTSDQVQREYLKIDILAGTSNRIFAVENKLKSRHTKDQLSRYHDKVKKVFKGFAIEVLGLCPTLHDAVRTQERLGGIARFISYESEVIGFLKEIMATPAEPRDLTYVEDYLDIVRVLVQRVKLFENGQQAVGSYLNAVELDAEVQQLRLGPLLKRLVYEEVRDDVLHFSEEKRHHGKFLVEDVSIASRSMQGNLTVSLTQPLQSTSCWVYLGIQLEGLALRRCAVFKTRNGTIIDDGVKHEIHAFATELETNYKLFSDEATGLNALHRPKHFPISGEMIAFSAYANSTSEFFLFRTIADDLGEMSAATVSKRFTDELERMLLKKGQVSNRGVP